MFRIFLLHFICYYLFFFFFFQAEDGIRDKLVTGVQTCALPILPIYGDGLYVRDWIHVTDHCAALDRVLHHGKAGEVYNIGARQEMPNIEIARLILKSLDKSEDLLTYVKDRPGHDRRYAIDPAKMENDLGWKPNISFAAGIQETINWYRDNPIWVDHVRSGA